MNRAKYLLFAFLLFSLIISNGGCVLLKNQGAGYSTDPIDPDWTPLYVQDEVIGPLDTKALIALVAPSVVSIISERLTYDRFFRAVPERGTGSGVIIDPQGYIVTNAHVVEKANSLTVTLSDGRTFDAIAWVMDRQTDLAVVQIHSEEPLPYIHFLRSSLKKLKLLEDVVAVGNALALSGGPTWTKGIVSYLGRSIETPNGVVLYDLIQTDAAINPGNSGGPLVNMGGQVVGINTAIAADAQNIGFAISTDTAIPIVYSLIRKGYVSWAWLGIRMLTVTPVIQSRYSLSVDHGVLIVEVISGSPAEKAGLQPNDVIVKFDDAEIQDTSQFRDAILGKDPGDEVSITYIRDSAPNTIVVKLAKRPSS